MTATDELRRLLDERGVEYRVSATGYSIDIGPSITAYANRTDTTLDVSLRGFTPEQAVEATLGRGTCRDAAGKQMAFFSCSACGATIERKHPRFCFACGRKVVDE